MRVLVAVPCGDMLPMPFIKSLMQLRLTKEDRVQFWEGSLVYEARNRLAAAAVEGGFDYVLWIDSDMTFAPDALDRLMADIEGRDMVCGIYVSRRYPFNLTIFSKVAIEHGDGYTEAIADRFEKIPEEPLTEIAACGFGMVLMRTSVIRDIQQKYGLPFSPVLGFGEDISFCMRATEAGHTIYADTTLRLGHIGHIEITDEWRQTDAGES